MKDKNYTGACKCVFEAKHPGFELRSETGMIFHPNQFYTESRRAIAGISYAKSHPTTTVDLVDEEDMFDDMDVSSLTPHIKEETNVDSLGETKVESIEVKSEAMDVSSLPEEGKEPEPEISKDKDVASQSPKRKLKVEQPMVDINSIPPQLAQVESVKIKNEFGVESVEKDVDADNVELNDETDNISSPTEASDVNDISKDTI